MEEKKKILMQNVELLRIFLQYIIDGVDDVERLKRDAKELLENEIPTMQRIIREL